MQYLISYIGEVQNWLDVYVDAMGNHVTLRQVNEKALEIVKAKEWFQTYMAPILLGVIGAAQGGPRTGSGPRSAPRTSEPPKVEPPKVEPPKVEPPKSTVVPETLTPLQRTAHQLVAKLPAAGKRVVVNIGGAGAPHEPADAINVNNQAVSRKNIPNHLNADGADIGKLLPKGTVDAIEGHNMAPARSPGRAPRPARLTC